MTEIIETIWIPMPDGTKLAARLWLPDGARGTPVPCILEYIPYRRRDRTRMRDESMHPLFADAGYASIRVDIRGYGDSDGLAEDEYSHQEMQDGVDVIAWIAEQVWCDGNVGMFGKSWGAYNSFQVASLRPPALKAIIPVMGCDDRWREDIHFYGGCLANDNFWWGSIMQLYNAMPPDPQIVGEDRWLEMWKERLEGAQFWPAMWLEHQTHDEMWRRGSICENYDDVQVPVYFFGGWADLFRDTPFRIAEHLNGPVKIMMGPWAHLYPHEGIPGPRADFVGEAIRFWDHWLKGIDTGLMDEPPLRFFMQESVRPSGSHSQREGRWIEEAGWPSSNVNLQRLWLNEGVLGHEPLEGAEMSVCSPQTFGAAGGDMCSFAIPGDMPVDCRIDAGGALSFRGPALDVPLDILGQPSISLQISADQKQGFVAVLLVDEAPDGAQTLITRGFANLTHRIGDTTPEPVIPGEIMEVTVPLHGIGYRVLKGHRLVVQVGSTYWPILWPAPAPVRLTLRAGTSALHLPLRENTAEAPAPHAPPIREIKRPVTRVRDGSMERSVHTDLTTGEVMHRFYLDGGVFGPIGDMRLDDIGTVLSDVSDRRYSIHADDPLSARATMEQTASFSREDWHAKIHCFAEQTATETEFHLLSRISCWSGDALIFEREETHAIPRNGM
ncbi:CocE/NonD family hydrolase [Ruegeria sp. 2205SS24-7]|uniref:CocE/NonD family hydrolase n=1 Tax=Ruegeria discodermiae TaxID=3064389 RepID=UPI002741C2D6|nr:CocE/NonD family hydrolase [Ruegeria sp. 2205SS24-7]MDP5215693.1 CocE/NonD family hydrolase [Ruegeria sp. 2205SS24-7]